MLISFEVTLNVPSWYRLTKMFVIQFVARVNVRLRQEIKPKLNLRPPNLLRVMKLDGFFER